MKVRALSLSSFKRVARPTTLDADILRARRAVLGKTVSLRIAPLGQVTLSGTNVEESARPDGVDAVWTLQRLGSQQPGYLLLHGLTADRLINGTLGLPPGRILRDLGTAERGIAAAVIGGVLRAMGSEVVVRLGRQDWRGGGLVRLVIKIAYGDFADFVRVDVPPDWLPPSDHASLLADASRMGLEIPLRIELARTQLMASDWSHARVGDAIVFDAPPAPAGDSGRPLEATLVCGRFAASLQITTDGQACLRGEFHQRARDATTSTSTFAMMKETTNMSEDNLDIDSLTLLAAAPIEVVAEIGRIVMSAEEITSLRPGSVLALGALTPHSVDIKVGDRSWAQGELVDVDGHLGVRLTSISATPDPQVGRARPQGS